MFPPGSYAVGVSVASTEPGEFLDDLESLPPDPDPWPSRLGEQLRVQDMTDAELATHLQGLQGVKAQLEQFEAELIDALAARRPAYADRRSGQPGAASGEWAAQLLDDGVSEFFADELRMILNCSRAAATRRWEVAATLQRRLPAARVVAADGELDWPRVRAIAEELGWPARETADSVLAEVEAVVLPRAGELSVAKLRDLVRAELIKRDPAAADRRRARARRESDVTHRGLGDGMSEIRSTLPSPEAAELMAVVDARARELKAAGDERPIGLIRAEVLHALVTRPAADGQPPVGAQITISASLDALEAAAAGAPGTGTEPPRVDGLPITPAQARELLERLDALCPGGLQPLVGDDLLIAVTDEAGRQLAAVTRAELERAVRRGEGLGPPPAINRYEPTPAQYRFVRTRDRGCRWPDCPLQAGWADLDHVLAHADGGETDCCNLCCLCRRHHRLKTHAHGWVYSMTPDGVLSVTTPTGVTRTSRPPGLPPPPDPNEPPPF